MTRPVQLLVDTDETLLEALRRRAARDGVSPGEAADALLRTALADEMGEATGGTPLADVIQGLMRTGGKGSKRPGGPI